MTTSSNSDAFPVSTTPHCSTTPLEASRCVAWVSAAGALVWGLCLVVFDTSVASIGSSSHGMLMVLVTIHHVGQALTSAISLKVGAVFAAVALAAQFMISISIVISGIESAQSLALLTTPLTCSACALFLAHRLRVPGQAESAE